MVIDSLDIDSSKSPLQDVDIINTDSEFENGELKPRADDRTWIQTTLATAVLSVC